MRQQTFGSIAETSVIHSGQEKFKQLLPGGSKSPLHTHEYKEVGVTRTPLANSSKQISAKTDKALRKPITVFWRNKETVSQCEGQNPEPVTFENLVVHFDQGKFKKLLSEGSLVLHIRKHRKVSMAKILEQKPEGASSQLLSASRVASQVHCEPKSPLPKQMWRPKKKALYEASGVATLQVRLSRKIKARCLPTSLRLSAAKLERRLYRRLIQEQ